LTKTILYLDQNYISYLTKARLGIKIYPSVAAYYENLYDALHEAVKENAAVCPVSFFHREESELDPRIAPELYRTLGELSCGTEFLFWGEILHRQTERALRQFLGELGGAMSDSWREAFDEDPQRPCPSPARSVDNRPIDPLVERTRSIKVLYERQVEAPVGDLEDQRRVEAMRLIQDFYVRPLENALEGKVDILSRAGLEFISRLLKLHSQLTQAVTKGAATEELLDFFTSARFTAVPFADIYSSLRAALVLDRERRTKGSDLNDVSIAATVLPYVDVFATDGHIKQLIQVLGLNRRYNVRVFGSRKADVLALTSLVEQLGKKPSPGA